MRSGPFSWHRGHPTRLALSCLCLVGLLVWPRPVLAGIVVGRVWDAESGSPIPGASFRATHRQHPPHGTLTDSLGGFQLELVPGRWDLAVQALGYEPSERQLAVGADQIRLDLPLAVQPLLMDEMLVRARRPGSAVPVPAFVQVISLADEGRLAASVPELLDQAAGVNIRRQGGLGSFSTISIRGSTAEQVQVYLDGVPLNQASGGGVDFGNLPVSGVESIEVYRGAVPARFGGNSIGGVVHLRTRAATGQAHGLVHASTGSFGTRRLGASVGGSRRGWRTLGLVDYEGSDNDFRFWDDNGTEYNPADDEWAERANSDFRSVRSLLKADRTWGSGHLQLHNTFDL
ncbi:TonB-dependent receptor plug domain-containing protein, partial [Candidatus Latescibacterota bacterium]